MLFSVQDTWSHSSQAFAHALPSQEATPGCPCEVPSLCSYLISIFPLALAAEYTSPPRTLGRQWVLFTAVSSALRAQKQQMELN